VKSAESIGTMSDEDRGHASQRGTPSRFRRNAAINLGVVVAFALAYFLWPGFGAGTRHVIALLGRGDVERLRAYLLSFGAWAPALSTAVMLLQAIVAPLPAFVVAMVNGLLFGAFWGSLLTWSTAVVGSVVCFYIARGLGRPAAERFGTKRAIRRVDDFFRRYGTASVLIARLIPLMSFSAVSYFAGLTSMSLRAYLAATAVGILPATVLFCVLGGQMTDWYRFGLYAVIGVVGLVLLGLLVRWLADERLRRKERANSPGQGGDR